MLKILGLTSHDLDGPDQGAALRARNIFRLLAPHGEVHVALASWHDPWGEHRDGTCGGFKLVRRVRFEPLPRIRVAARLRHELDPRFMNTDWLQTQPGDRAWLEQALGEYDLIWVHSVHLANRFDRWRWPRTVLDIDDIPSEFHRSNQGVARNPNSKIQHLRRQLIWQRSEKLLHERFDALCVCSQADRVVLGQPEKTFVVPNGFDAPAGNVPRQPAQPPRIGFIGNFAYEPNRLGMRWFVKNVWPLVLKKHPAARLRVAGARSPEQHWPAGLNIEPLGWLADADGEMATWSLTVVPVRAGGGTRVKIAQAFSRRCPVVSTSLGAYGYDVADGREIFIADAPGVFAEKCLRILAAPALGGQLAANAWEKFIKLWTWDAQAESVATVVKKVLAAPKS